MGFLSRVENFMNGGEETKKDWNEEHQDDSNNNFSMPNPDLQRMAVGDMDSIPTLEPVSKLTETAAQLEEKRAKEMKEQEQLQGRVQAAKTSQFQSATNISVSQFSHGKKRIQLGLKAREQGATRFGEYVFGEARPEFTSQNYRVQLSKAHGDHAIGELGKEFNNAVADLNNYREEM